MSNLPRGLPDYPTASYRVCSTPESLLAAVQVLSEHSHVFLDCEGRTLGLVGGKLSLLQLGVAQDTEEGKQHLSIFLIDILAFQSDKLKHLTPIFDILKSDEVFKVVFDGRMDASELFHGHGIQLNNVLDLQLADILSREDRAEGVQKQQQRLAGFLPKQELSRNPSLYHKVHKLNGMGSAMKEYGIDDGTKRKVNHNKWLKRPMDRASLLYAAEDICKIHQLYDVFVEEGYIDEDTLVQQSSRYIAMNANARPYANDKYNAHGLLPLGILPESTSSSSKSCEGCRRNLPSTAFAQSTSASEFCFVCRAIDAKAGRRNKVAPKSRV